MQPHPHIQCLAHNHSRLLSSFDTFIVSYILQEQREAIISPAVRSTLAHLACIEWRHNNLSLRSRDTNILACAHFEVQGRRFSTMFSLAHQPLMEYYDYGS
eukprot:scaffold40492_cov56-Attheya_sp.AAC.7